jgi:hypothetical protein
VSGVRSLALAGLALVAAALLVPGPGRPGVPARLIQKPSRAQKESSSARAENDHVTAEPSITPVNGAAITVSMKV